LLCFKHIFLYVAPAFGCYYLGLLWREAGVARKAGLFLRLAAASAAVLAITFGPLQYYDMIPQMLSRLFPVQRGLIHAYWAPNFWALYAAADKVLVFAGGMLGMDLGAESIGSSSFTGGLVQITKFSVLPQVESSTTALVTVVAMAPALVSLLRRPLPGELWPTVVYCSLCSFMFGYHVHEKAILIPVIPMAVSAVKSLASGSRDPSRFMFLSLIGTYSLFPLLIRPDEYPVKVGLAVGYAAVAWPLLAGETRRMGMSAVEAWYCTYGVVAIETYATFVHGAIFGEAWPFVPLMLVSCYCALGVTYAWGRMLLDHCN
jgi:alpha-1,3-glucosyltransferase